MACKVHEQNLNEHQVNVMLWSVLTMLVSTSYADFAHFDRTYAFKNFFLVSVA